VSEVLNEIPRVLCKPRGRQEKSKVRVVQRGSIGSSAPEATAFASHQKRTPPNTRQSDHHRPVFLANKQDGGICRRLFSYPAHEHVDVHPEIAGSITLELP